MCGVVGIYGVEDARVVKEMLHTVKHRGPDSLGYFVEDGISLGNARLRIIDLSPRADLPMVSEDGNYVLVYNGEIYNYKELRNKYLSNVSFNTTSDSEVLLKLYEKFKSRTFSLLDGDFAIGIYDIKKKSLILARDPFGVKPLYYSLVNNCLVFASELKAILKFDLNLSKISTIAVKEFLCFFTLMDDHTFFLGIKQLLPGHYLTFDKTGINITQYFNRNLAENETKFGDVSLLKKLLMDSVNLRMRADVRIGALLSGGLDSSIITKMMLMNNPDHRVHTFCAADDLNNPDIVYSRKVAESIGTNHHEIIFDYDDLYADLLNYLYHLEMPFLEPYFAYFCYKNIRDKCTGILCGQGADEFFGGYDQHRYYKTTISKTSLMFQLIYHSNVCKQHFPCGSLNDLLLFETKNWLPSTILKLQDSLSMAFGIETRVPFITKDVAEFAFSLPHSQKILGNERKRILKTLGKSIGLPGEVVNRKKFAAGSNSMPNVLKKMNKTLLKSYAKIPKNFIRPHKEMIKKSQIPLEYHKLRYNVIPIVLKENNKVFLNLYAKIPGLGFRKRKLSTILFSLLIYTLTDPDFKNQTISDLIDSKWNLLKTVQH